MSRLQLYDYQQQALNWKPDRGSWAYFMEMRLGKSITTIRKIQQLHHTRMPIRPVLWVTKSVCLYDLEAELFREGEFVVRGFPHKGFDRKPSIEEALTNDGFRKYYLTTYAQIRAFPTITKLPWDVAVFDESTRLKNYRAQVSGHCRSGFHHTRHKFILSGLPSPENALELFNQFVTMDGHFMGTTNFWHFKHEHTEQVNAYTNRIKPDSFKLIKDYLHDNSYIRTRAMVKVGPKKLYVRRHSEMENHVRKAYDQVAKEYAREMNGEWIETKYNPVKHTWMYRMCGGFDIDENLISTKKMEDLTEIIQEELDGAPVIVWCFYIAEVLEVTKFLNSKGVKAVGIVGNTDFDSRQDSIDKFRSGRVQAFVTLPSLFGMGIDLSIASTAIYYSRDPSNENRSQSEDRMIHSEKKGFVTIIDLITKDTIDDARTESATEKYVESKLMLSKSWTEKEMESICRT